MRKLSNTETELEKSVLSLIIRKLSFNSNTNFLFSLISTIKLSKDDESYKVRSNANRITFLNFKKEPGKIFLTKQIKFITIRILIIGIYFLVVTVIFNVTPYFFYQFLTIVVGPMIALSLFKYIHYEILTILKNAAQKFVTLRVVGVAKNFFMY